MNDVNIPSFLSSTVSLNSTSTSTSTEFDLINLPNSTTITPVVTHPDTTTTTVIAPDDIANADNAVETTTDSIAPSTKSTTLLPSPFTSTPIPAATMTDSHKRKAPPVNLIPEDASYENENSAVSKAIKSSRSWNSALRNARKARGPQWDWATAQ